MNEKLDQSLEALTEDILASYHGDQRTQRIGRRFLPSRDRIVNLLQHLRELVFPGYFGPKGLTEKNVRYHLGSLLVRLGQELTEEVYNCLCYAADADEGEPCLDKAGHITREFLQRVPEVRRMLALDAQAAYDGDPAAKSIEEVIYCYPGFYAVTVYRLAHELHSLAVPLMPRIMTEHAHGLTGTDIHPGAQIGESFFIDHATGVVIGETTRIGNNVKVYQGVTLGALSFPKDERGRVIKGLQRHPTIQENVTIYANATILGGETVISRGATVGANTFITQSVTADSTVVSKTPELHVQSKGKKKGSI